VRGVASTSDQRWEDFDKAQQEDREEVESLKIERF
jgi:hypothetical protein